MRLVNCSVGAHSFVGAQLDCWVVDLQLAYQAYAGSKGYSIQDKYMLSDMISLLKGGEQALLLAKEVSTFVGEQIFVSEKPDIEEFIYPLEYINFLPPVMRPGKVICVGLNYPESEEIKTRIFPEYPVLFHKVATSLIGHNQPIKIPRITKSVVYEGELAIVIGRKGKYIPREQAETYIVGYTIANDIGAPELERRTSQWTSGKMLDTFCPLGPALVTRDEAFDHHSLWIKTSLNGTVVQYGNTSEMIFDVPFLVSYISSLVTLEPGDLILTGSPKKSGKEPDPRTLMKAGDSISVEINGLGVLTNYVVAEE